MVDSSSVKQLRAGVTPDTLLDLAGQAVVVLPVIHVFEITVLMTHVPGKDAW